MGSCTCVRSLARSFDSGSQCYGYSDGYPRHLLEPSRFVLLEFYETGCPGEGQGDSASTNTKAGSESDEVWCGSVPTSHNVVATNAGNMDVWLFSDWLCEHEVAHIGQDGCTVAPSNYVVEAVRVLPKKK
ncbi:hypothetical protein PG988_001867 [Apiospora saccharicola]